MFPKQHIIIGLIVTLILFLIFPQITLIPALIIFLSSVLIDTDHYIYYISEKKSFNLKKAYFWFINLKLRLLKYPKKQRIKQAKGLLIFHGIEMIILTFFLSKIYPILFFISLGFLIHFTTDLIGDLPLGLGYRKISLIYAIYLNYKY